MKTIDPQYIRCRIKRKSSCYFVYIALYVYRIYCIYSIFIYVCSFVYMVYYIAVQFSQSLLSEIIHFTSYYLRNVWVIFISRVHNRPTRTHKGESLWKQTGYNKQSVDICATSQAKTMNNKQQQKQFKVKIKAKNQSDDLPQHALMLMWSVSQTTRE